MSSLKPICKPKKARSNTPLWNKVSRALQDYYRAMGLECEGRSKSCTGRAEVMHHCFSFKRYLELRLEEKNLTPLCGHCHHSAHQGIEETRMNYETAMEVKYGPFWKDGLSLQAREAPHRTRSEERDWLLEKLHFYLQNTSN